MKKNSSFIPYLGLLLLIVIGVPLVDYYAKRSHEIKVEIEAPVKVTNEVLTLLNFAL